MAELGYVEGKNFAAEYRMKPESLPQAAADLVRLNMNVIFANAWTGRRAQPQRELATVLDIIYETAA
jgi:hypothetical protein